MIALLALLATAAPPDQVLLLKPARVFDGSQLHEGWAVLVRGDRIAEVGPKLAVPDGAKVIELPGQTLLPGLIEGHAHVLLHPYDETSWDDQVLKEPEALRVARATNHLRATLMAGFTTLRDLGTEGAGYADAGLKRAVAEGIIPGPRMLVVTRAIVATGSYGPSGFSPQWRELPVGAEQADGADLVRVARDQISRGADWVKVYADYRWGPNGEARPTFTEAELRTLVEVAESSGRHVVAHASTAEGMRRAAAAGVRTIEHGDAGTDEVFALMAKKGIALCPTLAATEAIATYRGWKKGSGEEPDRVKQKKAAFARALAAKVPICMGGDVGVFAHGDNARELELMVEYGMTPTAALKAATSDNARFFDLAEQLGRVAPGLAADLLSVEGDPTRDIHTVRAVRLVLQAGRIVRGP